MNHDVFDPAEVSRERKIYPVDVVDARRNIGDGPKRLYAQLFRIAVTTDRRKHPWPGYVYASEKFLAGRLGKSESQIRRDSAALRAAGLVHVGRPNKKQNNRYYFLWDSTFDSADLRRDEQLARNDDGANMRSGNSADTHGHSRSDGASMRGHDSADMHGPTKEKQIVEANAPRSAREVEGGFLKFQAAYPEPKRKIKIDSACQAYMSVIDGKPGEHKRLIAGLERYKSSAEWQRSLSQNEGRYIPMMEKFISDRRYLDHPTAAHEIADGHRLAADAAAKGRWDPATEQFLQ